MTKLPTGRFPFISLPKAIERAREIYGNDKSGKGLKVPEAFAAWGYSEKSSGGFQTVAALKGYGILVDEGANNDRSVKLTRKARHFFQSEIASDQEELLSDFALHPPLMRHLFEHWEGGLVSDPVARTYLKTTIGMNDQSARSALSIYKDNLSFIVGMGEPETEEDAETPVDESNDVQQGVRHETGQVMPAQRQPQQPAPSTIVVEAPELQLHRTVTGGYVIRLSGAIMNKAHADEAIQLITALKAALPDAPAHPSPPGSTELSSI